MRAVFFLSLFSGCTLLLTFDRVWNQPVFLGTNTKFKCDAAGGGLRLLQTSKEQMGWIKLRVRNAQRNADRPHATLEQAPLAVLWEDGCWCIGSSNWRSTLDRKFLWNSGVPVEFWIDNRPLSESDLEDWEVHVKDGPPDCPDNRLVRQIAQGLLWTLLVCGAAGTILSTRRALMPTPGKFTDADVMALLIGGVRGDNDKETQILQDVLGRVTGVQEPAARERALDKAVKAWKIPQNRRNATWFKARSRLRTQVEELCEDLHSSLGWKP